MSVHWYNHMIRLLSVVVLTAIFYVKSETYRDPTVEEWICVKNCHDVRRYCSRLPNHCGHCINDHVEIDGICRPASIAAAESDPEVALAIDTALERKRRKETENFDLEVKSNKELKEKSSVVNANVNEVRKDEIVTSSYYGYAGLDKTTAITLSIVIASCVAGGVILVILLCCMCHHYQRQKRRKAAEAEYIAAGQPVPPVYTEYPDKPPAVDRKLAESAQMYHYQHQKQQMLEMERAQQVAAKSDTEEMSDDEAEDEHFTVYECPGLATTGELEIRNPLYSESPIPATPQPPPPSYNETTDPSPLINGHDK